MSAKLFKPLHAGDHASCYKTQLSLLPEAEFNATLPAMDTLALSALRDLVQSKALMQKDWLSNGSFKSWRLAAAIHELNELGWQVESTRIGRQALYKLKPKARQAAYSALKVLDASKAKV